MRQAVILGSVAPYLAGLQEEYPGWDFAFSFADDVNDDVLRRAEVVLGWSDKVHTLALRQENGPLRWVQVISAGVDNLPLDEFKAAGVALTTTSGIHAKPIAESAFAMLLGLARGMRRADALQRQAHWDTKGWDGGMLEIHGATIGILGAGHVGTAIARVARGFGMRVLGLHRSSTPREGFDKMYANGSLTEMLAQCDIVVNILPLTEDTRGLIDENAFQTMKDKAAYISVGRGATTDTGALVQALQSGRLACAGLDVVDPEPLPADNPLWGMEQVLIAPHIAGKTPYYMQRTAEIFRDNFAVYCGKGAPDINVVDLDRGY